MSDARDADRLRQVRRPYCLRQERTRGLPGRRLEKEQKPLQDTIPQSTFHAEPEACSKGRQRASFSLRLRTDHWRGHGEIRSQRDPAGPLDELRSNDALLTLYPRLRTSADKAEIRGNLQSSSTASANSRSPRCSARSRDGGNTRPIRQARHPAPSTAPAGGDGFVPIKCSVSAGPKRAIVTGSDEATGSRNLIPQGSLHISAARGEPLRKCGPRSGVDLERIDRLVNSRRRTVINHGDARAVRNGGGPAHQLAGFERFSYEPQHLTRAQHPGKRLMDGSAPQPVKSLFQRMGLIVARSFDGRAEERSPRDRGRGDRNRQDGHRTAVRSPHPHDPATPSTMGSKTRSTGTRPASRNAERSNSRPATASGRVVIEVSDDGGGINRPKVASSRRGQGADPPGTIAQ